MSSLTHAETEKLASLAAFEHGRRGKHRESLRKAVRAARADLRTACAALGGNDAIWIPISDQLHIQVKTVQSQRALDRAALASAIGQVSDDDVARVAAAKRSVVGRPAEENVVRAWWDEVVRLAHRQKTVPTRSVTLVPRKCPRGDSDPSVHAATDHILGLVGALQSAEASSENTRVHAPSPAEHAGMVATLDRVYQGQGPTVCVNTTDGERHWYKVKVSERVARKTTTPAHLRNCKTVSHIMPHLHNLYRERASQKSIFEGIPALLKDAKEVGAQRKRHVQLLKQQASPVEKNHKH